MKCSFSLFSYYLTSDPSAVYERLGYEWASTLLAMLALILIVPMYAFYFKGSQIRAKSRFAQSLTKEGLRPNSSDEETADGRKEKKDATP